MQEDIFVNEKVREEVDRKLRLDVYEDLLSSLTDNEKNVIKMYYFGRLSIICIAKILKLCRQRTGQIHLSALRKLRNPKRWEYYKRLDIYWVSKQIDKK